MKNLSRRSFLSLMAASVAGLALASFPKKADAWISYQFANSDIELLKNLGFQ